MFALLLAALFATSATTAPVDVQDHEVDDSSPDMLSILESLKGSNTMETLSNVANEYKLITNVAKKVLLTSPLVKNMLEETAKNNVEARIVLRLAENQVPDMHDLFDLLHNRKKGFSQDFHNTYMKSPKFQKFLSMIHGKSPIFDSSSDTDEFLKMFTGLDVTIDPNLITEVQKRTYKPNLGNLAEANVLYLVSWLQKNFKTIGSFTFVIGGGRSISFVDMMGKLASFDYSQLSNIKEASPQLVNDKYVVSGKQTLVTDPDVVQILQDKQKAEQLIQQRSTDQSKAESVVSDMLEHIADLGYRLKEALKASQGLGEKSSKPEASFG